MLRAVRESTLMRYLPYHRLDGRPNVVVDGSPTLNTILSLTHWPHLPAPADLARDLSAQMAFAYLGTGMELHGSATTVTNNHFDQDGLVGLFALVNPEEALPRRGLLEGLAEAGDFATFRDRTAVRLAMTVAAYADQQRSPLHLEDDPSERVAQLYSELFGLLPELCDHPDRSRPLWAEDDDVLARSEQLIAAGAIRITELPDVDLAIVDVPERVQLPDAYRFAHLRDPGPHPSAVANATDRFAVLTRQGGQYRFYYRYESWVAYRSRRPRPRRDLRRAAQELTSCEPGPVTWTAQPSGALEPVLTTDDGAASDLEPDRVLEVIVRHLALGPPDWDPYSASPRDR